MVDGVRGERPRGVPSRSALERPSLAARRLPIFRRNYLPIPQSPHPAGRYCRCQAVENAWAAHLVAGVDAGRSVVKTTCSTQYCGPNLD